MNTLAQIYQQNYQTISKILPYLRNKLAKVSTGQALIEILLEQPSVSLNKKIIAIGLAFYMHKFESTAQSLNLRQLKACVLYIQILYQKMPIPEFTQIMHKLQPKDLTECSSCVNWDRAHEVNIRVFVQNNILQWCQAHNKIQVTLVSIACGFLLQEAHLAHTLAKAGITVNFILIDPLYLNLETTITKGYDYEHNRTPQKAIKEFEQFLSMLHGRASLLGVFSNLDSYISAYDNSPAPKYNLDKHSTVQESDIDLLKHKQHCNNVWLQENIQYGARCRKIMPDLIIAIHPAFANGSSFKGIVYPNECSVKNCNGDNDYPINLYDAKRMAFIFKHEYLIPIHKAFNNSSLTTKIFISGPDNTYEYTEELKAIGQDLGSRAELFIGSHRHATIIDTVKNPIKIDKVALSPQNDIQSISPPATPKKKKARFFDS